MSVMNGFEKEIRARILGAAAHIQVLGAEGGVRDWEKLSAEVATHPEVVASAPFVNAHGHLIRSSLFAAPRGKIAMQPQGISFTTRPLAS